MQMMVIRWKMFVNFEIVGVSVEVVRWLVRYFGGAGIVWFGPCATEAFDFHLAVPNSLHVPLWRCV